MRRTTNSVIAVILTSVFVTAISTGTPGIVRSLPLQQAETFDQHLAKGKEALDKDDRATAYWELESARIKEPDRPEPYVLLATLRIRESRLEEAIEKAETGIKYQPDNPGLHTVLAQALWRSRKTDRAAAEIEKAYRLGETSGEFYLLMSEVMLLSEGRNLAASTGRTPADLLDQAYAGVLARYQEALKVLPAADPNRPEFEKRIRAITALREFQSLRDDKTFTQPKPITIPRPDYTEEARKQKITGSVRVVVFINETGETEDAIVIIGLGFGLDQSAIDVVHKVKWSPAMKDGKPISCCVAMVISYSLL